MLLLHLFITNSTRRNPPNYSISIIRDFHRNNEPTSSKYLWASEKRNRRTSQVLDTRRKTRNDRLESSSGKQSSGAHSCRFSHSSAEQTTITHFRLRFSFLLGTTSRHSLPTHPPTHSKRPFGADAGHEVKYYNCIWISFLVVSWTSLSVLHNRVHHHYWTVFWSFIRERIN